MSVIIFGSTAVSTAVFAKDNNSNPVISMRRNFDRPVRQEVSLENKAQLLGITVADLQARFATGKNFGQIIQDLGITPEQLRAKALVQIKARLQQLVTDGKITQAEADKRFEMMSTFKAGVKMRKEEIKKDRKEIQKDRKDLKDFRKSHRKDMRGDLKLGIGLGGPR